MSAQGRCWVWMRAACTPGGKCLCVALTPSSPAAAGRGKDDEGQDPADDNNTDSEGAGDAGKESDGAPPPRSGGRRSGAA